MLVENTFSKSKVKNIFEPNVFKWVVKIVHIRSSLFALLIINVKILFNFHKECAHLINKKRHLKKTRIVHFQGLSVLKMQKHFLFLSSFEHVNFSINEKYSKKIMIIQNIMFHL